MANLVALAQFDLLELDFNYYRREILGVDFDDNVNVSFKGVTYQDQVSVLAKGDAALDIFGSDFVVSQVGAVTGGTVNAIGEASTNPAEIFWYAEGFSASAAAIFDAALTASNADELAIIAEVLSGADTITLSNSSDRMNGFGGNDEFTGGGGNDILDGGAGSDTAIYANAFANVTISFEGNVLFITAPGEGTDQLTNFEFVRFAGETRSVRALADPVAPTVVSFSPADGTTGVAAAADISVTFSEQIERGTGTITLRAGSADGDIVEQFDAATSARLEIGTTTLTIDPTADLVEGTRYFVTFDGGAVIDLVGNKSEAIVSYDFSTITTTPPAAADWRLFGTDGFVASIGGSGQVFGTGAFQDIRVEDVAGAVSFDASFNRGGDIIRLSGDAADWTVTRSGSSAVFNDGDTSVTIPVGTAGMAVVFDDGARTLKFDGAQGSFTIGGQSFGAAVVDVTAAADGTPLPTGADEDALGRLFVASGKTVSAAGELSIFGSNGAETVTLTGGSAQFDASFNRGGDTLLLGSAAEGFTAVRQGSSVRLETDGVEVLLPVGTAGMVLSFAPGDDRDLLFDAVAGGFVIGDQLITTTPASLASFG